MHAFEESPRSPDARDLPDGASSPRVGEPATAEPTPAIAPATQPRNPLHGLTLQVIVERLVDAYGWDGLADRIPVRCFQSSPSVKSSLTFLRKTPWAREKVEGLYLFLQREQRRSGRSR